MYSAQSHCYRIYVNVVLPTQLLAPNPDRDSFVVVNESGVLYVKLGRDAAPDNFTYRLTAGSTLEVPAYAGYVTAVKDSAPGWVMCSEII